jgi:hypothetical protein
MGKFAIVGTGCSMNSIPGDSEGRFYGTMNQSPSADSRQGQQLALDIAGGKDLLEQRIPMPKNATANADLFKGDPSGWDGDHRHQGARGDGCASAPIEALFGVALRELDGRRDRHHRPRRLVDDVAELPHSVPPICAPFIRATRCTGDAGDRQSMISRRYGVRSVRQRSGSDDARCDSTRSDRPIPKPSAAGRG